MASEGKAGRENGDPGHDQRLFADSDGRVGTYGMPDELPVDGVSLVPLLEGKWQARPRPMPFRSGKQLALVDDRYSLYSPNNGKSWELYDLAADPASGGTCRGRIPPSGSGWFGPWPRGKPRSSGVSRARITAVVLGECQRTTPPLTRTIWPVMKAAAGEASQTAAAATSSGVPSGGAGFLQGQPACQGRA